MAAPDRRGAARAAVMHLAAAQAVSVGVMFLGLVVLARLLDPADFGIYALAMAIYAVARTIAEAGFLQDAIRREASMPSAALALAAAMSLALSLAVAALVVGGLALLPDGLAQPALAAVLVPMMLTLPVGALTLQREARLHREVAFAVPARAGVAGIVAETGVAIALAIAGYGATALAFGFVAGVLVRAATVMALSRGTRPVRPALAEFGPLARFGWRMTSVSLLPKAADLALLGALSAIAGAAATGLFNRSQRVCNLLDDTIFEALRPMMLPVISAALRDGVTPAEVVATKHEYLAPIAFAGFGAVLLLADPLVRTLLGPGWDEAVAPVRILALAGLTMPVTKMAQKVLTAMGRLDDFARIQNVQLAVRVVLGAAGALVSLEAFCAAVVAASVLKAVLILRWERVHAGAALRALGRTALRAAGIAAATLAGPAAVLWGTDLPPAATMAASVALGGPTWLLCLRLTDHPLMGEIAAALRPRPSARSRTPAAPLRPASLAGAASADPAGPRGPR